MLRYGVVTTVMVALLVVDYHADSSYPVTISHPVSFRVICRLFGWLSVSQEFSNHLRLNRKIHQTADSATLSKEHQHYTVNAPNREVVRSKMTMVASEMASDARSTCADKQDERNHAQGNAVHLTGSRQPGVDECAAERDQKSDVDEVARHEDGSNRLQRGVAKTVLFQERKPPSVTVDGSG